METPICSLKGRWIRAKFGKVADQIPGEYLMLVSETADSFHATIGACCVNVYDEK
jgi:hypothetical protein